MKVECPRCLGCGKVCGDDKHEIPLSIAQECDKEPDCNMGAFFILNPPRDCPQCDGSGKIEGIGIAVVDDVASEPAAIDIEPAGGGELHTCLGQLSYSKSYYVHELMNLPDHCKVLTAATHSKIPKIGSEPDEMPGFRLAEKRVQLIDHDKACVQCIYKPEADCRFIGNPNVNATGLEWAALTDDQKARLEAFKKSDPDRPFIAESPDTVFCEECGAEKHDENTMPLCLECHQAGISKIIDEIRGGGNSG